MVVVGHSLGAAIGVELTARHPDLVAGLVMVDAAPIGVPSDVSGVLGGFIDGMSGPDPVAVRRSFVEQLLFLPTDDHAVKQRVVADMTAVPNDVALACFRGLAAWPGAESLRSVQVPVLAIHADQGMNPPARLTELCPTLTNARTAGVGHFNQLLAPAEVNRLIDGWLPSLG